MLGTVGLKAWFRPTILCVWIMALSISPFATADTINGFSGPYDASHWELVNPVGGSFDLSGVPAIVTLVGPDEDLAGSLDFEIEVPANAVISFSWAYASDDIGMFDQAFYVLDGVEFFLAQNDSETLSGTESLAVMAGNIFGFRVTSVDGLFGPGILTIGDFSVSQENVGVIPEPSTVLLLGVGLALLLGARRKR